MHRSRAEFVLSRSYKTTPHLQIGSLAVAYYFATTAIAVVTGIVLVLTIHPGNPEHYKAVGSDQEINKRVSTIDTFLDLIR